MILSTFLRGLRALKPGVLVALVAVALLATLGPLVARQLRPLPSTPTTWTTIHRGSLREVTMPPRPARAD